MGLAYTFRFDDVSINTDMAKLCQMLNFLRSTFKADQLQIKMAVSPAVCDMRGQESSLKQERVFPSLWHTESDYRIFYRMENIGIPHSMDQFRREGISVASHGMVHADHRLLDRGAQEMSIIMSCALLQTKTFVPPFWKYNRITEEICQEQEIFLVKFDSSWRHLVYHPFDYRNPNYYVHTHDFAYQSFCARFTPEGFGA